ncbi:thermonuclease family protein [Methylomonas rivi]|uniref:Thermonuclease family protein n=1 Tax=Methylomonas rivi TaxID=2952226 RepID=A0ABT1TZ38_9GAMM|nr:thermonuclease family protein [Methylomonas sp. WSC-6]MBS4053045.1 thermonuclease family protein [Methylomonas sp.]MCQ8126832.1 thermonuclease family protein [Methylomonas sp. WSC-6]
MLNKTVALQVCLLAILPSTGHADVFEWTDGQGRHHYADRKQANAKILTVEPGVSYYRVEKVFDGDTILLSDGRKVRLLGVNTPEIAGRNKNAEPGGEQAKAWLRQRIEHQKVRLEGDVEKHDKYQRSLAYVFTEDKTLINLELVRQGLAAVNIYPPNLKYVQALLDAQQNAERAGLGIWALPAYAPQPFDALNGENYRGWKRVTGKVRALKRTAKYSYLQFSDRASVRVENTTLNLFPPLRNYVGQSIEARGWVAKNKDRFAVQARHSGDIKPLKN